MEKNTLSDLIEKNKKLKRENEALLCTIKAQKDALDRQENIFQEMANEHIKATQDWIDSIENKRKSYLEQRNLI